MRKVSSLVGLTLLALAATARAQESAPASAAPREAAATAPAANPAATPSAAPAAVADPVPAAEPVPAAAPLPAARKKLQIGVSFLPMALGKFTASAGGVLSTVDAAFAYGFGFSAGYVVRPGLTIGIAPQAIFNVTPKEPRLEARQYDVMARVAYAHPLEKATAVYVEVLPGYSLIKPSVGDTAKGFVLGFGAGLAIDVSRDLFANVGAGYQIGFQKRTSGEGAETDVKTRYVRVALGLGVRL